MEMSSDTRILALDLGRKMGWAELVTNGTLIDLVTAGRWELLEKSSDPHRGRILARFVADIIRLITTWRPSVVVWEHAMGANPAYLTEHGELRACVLLAVERTARPLEPDVASIPTSTWKKLVTGHGNATKDEVRLVIEDKFPQLHPPTEALTQDTIDAIAVGVAWAKQQEQGNEEE